VEVAEKYVPFFKTGKQLRDRLNGGVDTPEDDDDDDDI
jgi:integration host factor subunit beta